MTNTHNSQNRTRAASLPVSVLFITTLISTVLFTQSLHAAEEKIDHALSEFSAVYAVQKFGIKVAEANYKLRHTDTGYKFTQFTELYGLASMFADDTVSVTSIVDMVDSDLLLKKHIYIQTGREKNRDEDIKLQWDTAGGKLNGKVTGIVRSKPINHDVDKPVWDVLSFQIPLMIEANAGQKIYPYTALLKGEIDDYKFELISTETVNIEDKKYETLHLVRNDPVKNRQLRIWLLPELNNIPLIVENYRDDKLHSRVQLEKVSFGQDKKFIHVTTAESPDDDDI